MRVAVVGATGNIGTSVVDALTADEDVERVDGLARHAPSWSPPKTTFVPADVTSSDLVPHFRGADTVVILAWIFQPTHQPMTTWNVNVLGTIRVLEAAAAAGVRNLVYSSSLAAYSPGPGRHVDESWPTHSMPVAAYGREKAYLERYLDAFELRNPEMRIVRIRPCFSFKHQSASQQRRIFAGPFVPRSLLRPGRLPVLPIPAGLRFQALHTTDLAEAFRLAVLDGDARGAYNVAADPIFDQAALGTLMDARTVRVPAAATAAAVGAGWKLRIVPASSDLLRLLLSLPTLDSSRIRNELGWRPRYSGFEALREFLGGLVAGAGMATPPLVPDRA